MVSTRNTTKSDRESASDGMMLDLSQFAAIATQLATAEQLNAATSKGSIDDSNSESGNIYDILSYNISL